MSKILIIAEAGVNYNGSLKLAMRMAEEAKRAGADIVKFQTGIPEKVMSRYAVKADYQLKNTGKNESQLEMIRKLMLKFEDFIPLKRYCEDLGIKFLSTPFDLSSIDFLEKLGCDLWKIPSGEITNLPYLERIAATKKPIIMSTGMSIIEEIDAALQILHINGACDITLLHCTTEYPTPFKDVNLRAMKTLRERFQCDVGYSDHTLGVEVPIAAAVLGAKVIEKHFTLNRNMQGPDHKASLEPEELAKMIQAIRNVEVALGTGIKQPAEAERRNIAAARKSIVALKNIKRGEILSELNITVKRPGTGVSPMKWYDVLGTKAVKDFKEDELITL